MWLRYNKDGINPKGAIVWVDDDEAAQEEVDKGNATRCTGPDGVAFGEAMPEDIEAQIEAEEALKPKKRGRPKKAS